MKVKITRACGVNGKNCKPGDIVDVSDADARYLASVGKGEPEPEKAAQPEGKGKRK